MVPANEMRRARRRLFPTPPSVLSHPTRLRCPVRAAMRSGAKVAQLTEPRASTFARPMIRVQRTTAFGRKKDRA